MIGLAADGIKLKGDSAYNSLQNGHFAAKGNLVSSAPVDPPHGDESAAVPMLGYRSPIDDAPVPAHATGTQLLIAFGGTFIYLLLTAFFTLVLANVGQTWDVTGIACAALPVLVCGWRAMAAIMVIVDHFRAR